MSGPPETIRLTTWIFSTLALATVTLRIYTRTFIARSLGWDDAAIVLALVCSVGLLAIWSIQIPFGLGQHLDSIPLEWLPINLKLTWAALFPYYGGLCFVKASALLQCLRIFKISRVRIACFALLAFVALFGIWTVLSAFLTCWPVAYTWNRTVPGGRCVNQMPVLYANAGVNIATDFAITLLPMPVLQGLSLSRRQKRGLIAVFGIGLFACATSIIRLRALARIDAADITSTLAPTVVWSAVELNTSIVCACCPALGPLLSRLSSRFLRAAPPNHHHPGLLRSDLAVVLSGSTCAGGYGGGGGGGGGGSVLEWAAGVSPAKARRWSSASSAPSTLSRFAGFTGRTGDAELDEFLLKHQRSVDRISNAGSRSTRPKTVPGRGDGGELEVEQEVVDAEVREWWAKRGVEYV